MPLNQNMQIVERGDSKLSPEHARANRITIGHAEGYTEAFANIYSDLANVISALKAGQQPPTTSMAFPKATDGLRSMAAV